MANLNMARLSAYPVFLAVYEERRLVKAAERLCVTPSAVSHALRDFEQSLGTKLFERTSEGVQPTTAGQRLYAKVKPLVVGIEAAERELRSETAPEQTDFAFASIHTFIKAFFVPILERMQKDYEPMKVRFLTRSMAGTVKAVANDEALIGSTMLPLERPERFYVVPLTEIQEYFVICPRTLTRFKENASSRKNHGRSRKFCSNRSSRCLVIPFLLQPITAISVNTDFIWSRATKCIRRTWALIWLNAVLAFSSALSQLSSVIRS